MPALGRHGGDVDGLKASAGQVAEEPVQFSATSQGPAEPRQVLVEDAKPSAGHVFDDPSHISATSQMPAELRQTTPALPAGCVQLTDVPSHWSTVQGLPSLVHGVVAWALPSAGQLVPEQVSATSHSSTAARQVGAGLVAMP
jgi:hypothetical protein